MPKSEVSRGARRQRSPVGRAEFPSTLEGQIGEDRKIPKISQETLAEMIGTTRSRVNFFMNKFRDLGFIEYNGDIKVNHSLLTVVLHD